MHQSKVSDSFILLFGVGIQGSPLFACIVVSIACVLVPAYSLCINILKHDRADQIIAELGRQGGTAEGGGGYNFDKETQTDFI